MKARITGSGTLVVTAESELEQFALNQWAAINFDTKLELSAGVQQAFGDFVIETNPQSTK